MWLLSSEHKQASLAMEVWRSDVELVYDRRKEKYVFPKHCVE